MTTSPSRDLSAVEAHYTVAGLRDRIDEGLRALGKDPERLTPADLAPVDEFHVRGRESTVEMIAACQPRPGAAVLDIGSGLGGTARLLASEHGCSVVGIDLTRSFCELANELSARVGLADKARFECASALDLPFPADSFDIVWTEHVQMNVEDKARFYGEAARVLRPGGKLVFHDIFRGPGPAVRFPVPWAQTSSTSFLAEPEAVRSLLQQCGFSAEQWDDSTEVSARWFENTLARVRAQGPAPLGIHLLMGSTSRAKLENLLDNLRDRSVVTVQAVLNR